MRRRDFITLVSSVATWPLAARAQRSAMPVIGFLHSGSAGPSSTNLAQFRRGLSQTGFVEGNTVIIDYRWAEDRFDRLPALATELVERNVSLIGVGGGDIAALAAKSATTTIPIVVAIGADPVQQGIVASLNRPGGNITGVTFLAVEIRPKMVELIRELIPQGKKIAVVGNPNRPGFEHLVNDVVKPAEEIPAIFGLRESVIAGGLMSYGASIEDAYRQAGVYAGRILKGEKPADLPVIQPTKFELVINL